MGGRVIKWAFKMFSLGVETGITLLLWVLGFAGVFVTALALLAALVYWCNLLFNPQ